MTETIWITRGIKKREDSDGNEHEDTFVMYWYDKEGALQDHKQDKEHCEGLLDAEESSDWDHLIVETLATDPGNSGRVYPETIVHWRASNYEPKKKEDNNNNDGYEVGQTWDVKFPDGDTPHLEQDNHESWEGQTTEVEVIKVEDDKVKVTWAEETEGWWITNKDFEMLIDAAKGKPWPTGPRTYKAGDKVTMRLPADGTPAKHGTHTWFRKGMVITATVRQVNTRGEPQFTFNFKEGEVVWWVGKEDADAWAAAAEGAEPDDGMVHCATHGCDQAYDKDGPMPDDWKKVGTKQYCFFHADNAALVKAE